jgi:hypothetical protein
VPPFQPTITAGVAQPGPGTPAERGPGGATPPGPYAGGGAPYAVDGKRDGSTWPAGSGRIIRKPLVVAGLAVLAAAGIGAGLAVALSSGSTSTGTGNNASGGGAATSPPVSASRAATVQRSSAIAKPTPPPNPAACVSGTWKSVNQQLISNINGQPTVFTGSGAVSTFLADGTITTTYSNEVFRATVDGVQWTEVLRGTAAGHWAVDNGDILYSAITSDGTEILYADGIYNNSGPLEALPGAVPYQCSGNTLRESFPTGGSSQLARLR